MKKIEAEEEEANKPQDRMLVVRSPQPKPHEQLDEFSTPFMEDEEMAHRPTTARICIGLKKLEEEGMELREKRTLPDGSVYTGQWKNELRHGYGE